MIIIKSQDNETIGKYVEVKADENVVKGFSQFGSLTVLGAYKSRERAIEVLDAISNQVVKSTSRDYMSGNYRIKQDFVYQMPSK